MLLGIILLIISILNMSLLKETFIEQLEFLLFSFVPYLFIIIIVGNLLISYIKCDKLYLLFNKFFKISYNSSIKIIILAPILGNIATIKLINSLYENKKIDFNEANYLLKFNIYINPLFILSIFYKRGILLIISAIISNIIISLIINKKRIKIYQEVSSNIKPITSTIADSINMFTESYMIAISYIILFSFLINVLKKYIKNNYLQIIIFSFLEISQIATFNINNNLLLAIVGFLLSFNGLSIMMQAKSILNPCFSIKEFIKYRFISGIISFILVLGGSYIVL